jgi:D-arabinose 1-dehydrogenase-like Zn-dependent alcohol dehydrogenase
MQAALLTCFGAPLVVHDIEVPIPGPGEVLVRTASCGICRTDVHIMAGVAYRPTLPHVLGHEPAGTVLALGSGVDCLEMGDRVVPYLFDYCGHCTACAQGDEAQCGNSPAVLGVTRNGAFAEYFLARADNLLLVPESVPLSEAGLVSCGVITAIRATRRAQIVAGDRVGIVGAGGIGLLILQLLVNRQIDVVIFDSAEEARGLALGEGAAAAYAPDASPKGLALERVFDLVGTAQSTALAAALLTRRGRIVIIGEEAEFLAIDSIAIAQREIEIVGSRNGARSDWREAMRLMAAGIVRPRIDRHVSLSEINAGLDVLRRGEVRGRVIVEVAV